MDEIERIFSTFLEIKNNPQKYLENLKKNSGKRLIACMPMYLPEEMVYASGMLPVYIPKSKEPVTIGSKHLQNFFCGYARGIVDLSLKGKLDFLDGIIFQDTCHTLRPVFDIIDSNHPYHLMKRINMPVVLSSHLAKPFLVEELKKMKLFLERFTGNAISDEVLKKAIRIYNEDRELLAKLYELRRKKPELIRAKEMVATVVASMLMPKEEHSLLLNKLLSSISARKRILPERKVKVILTGSLCEEPDEDLLDIIEEFRGIVVDDDLYTGSRYFVNKVPDLPDPINALASAYLNMTTPCPTRINKNNILGEYLVNMAKKAEAQGIIILMVKFCEAHDYTYPHMRRFFDDAGIPYIMIKTEREAKSVEQIRTRLQAFFEILGKE